MLPVRASQKNLNEVQKNNNLVSEINKEPKPITFLIMTNVSSITLSKKKLCKLVSKRLLVFFFTIFSSVLNS